MKQKNSTNPATGWQSRDEFLSPFSVVFDRLLDQHFPELKQDFGISFSKGAYPKVDIIDYTDSVCIHAEITGWDKEDIEITVENSILTIAGNLTVGTKPLENGTYIVKELKRSTFTRSFRLADKLDENSVNALFEDGLLKISIAKKEEEKPKKKIISIK
jgi:HSP20 family protein